MKALFVLLFIFVVSLSCIFADGNKQFNNNKELTKQERLIYNIEFELERNADPGSGEIPANIKQQEINFVRKLPTRNSKYSMKKLSDQPKISEADWKPRGPWNTGGRFLCIAFDVNNENIINAGAASGGMWRTNDKGKSWVKTSDMLSVQSIYCLVQDKRKGKTNNWYYGTGEMLSTTDRSVMTRARTMNAGGGIWKSEDNGASWHPIESTLGGDPSYPDNPFQGVWNIVVDNKAPFGDILYASCYGGIYRSENDGETWNLVLGDKNNMPFASYIIQNELGVFYAGVSSITLTGDKPKEYGLFRSIDGLKWENITPSGFEDLTRTIKIAASKSNPNIIYFFAEKPTKGNDPYYFGSGVKQHYLWKYTDEIGGTGTWTNRSSNLPNGSGGVARINTLGSYCMTITVKPDDEDVVIIGGTNVYVSTDGFATRTNTTHIGGYYPGGGYDLENQYCHPDIHAYAIPQSNSKGLFVANDGGIHSTDDFTIEEPKWTALNNGLLCSQFYTIAIDHAEEGDPFIFGGLQDNSSQYTFTNDIKKPWPAVIGGDGMATAIADNKDFILGSWYNGSFVSFRFDEDTLDHEYMYLRPKFMNSSNFEFYTLFALDPNDNTILYMPARKDLYRKTKLDKATRDTAYRNTDWDKIATDDYGNSITAIGVSIQPANRVYFGTSRGRVYRLDDATGTSPIKTNITSNLFPENAYCSSIDVDPKNADDIIVVFSNYHVKSIFHSSDGGDSFNEVSGNLEDSPDGGGAGPGIRKVKKVYIDEIPIYLAATTAGLFSTMELSGTSTQWVREGPGIIGSVIIDWIDARQGEGYVVIATQGAGVFSGKYTLTGIETKDREFSFFLSDCMPNPVIVETKIEFTLPKSDVIEMKLYDANGRIVDILAEGFFPAGKSEIIYDVKSLNSGVYFYTLVVDDKRITKRMIILE